MRVPFGTVFERVIENFLVQSLFSKEDCTPRVSFNNESLYNMPSTLGGFLKEKC